MEADNIKKQIIVVINLPTLPKQTRVEQKEPKQSPIKFIEAASNNNKGLEGQSEAVSDQIETSRTWKDQIGTNQSSEGVVGPR